MQSDSTAPAERGEAPRILLAVDNRENLRALQRHLAEYPAPTAFRNAHFDTADGAERAAALPGLAQTALVILDCVREIAPDTVRRLRTAAPQIAIVAVSDPEDEECAAALAAAGADDYLPRARLSGYWLWHALATAYARRAAQRAAADHSDVGAALDRMGDTFFALDRDWRFTYVNRHFEELMGVAAGELIGQNIWERFPFLVGTAVEEHYRQALAGQEMVSFERESLLFGGWHAITAYPSPDGLSVYSRDITALKQTERERDQLYERVAAKRKRLIAVLEHIPVGIIIVDAPSGRLWMSNQRVEEILGHPLRERSDSGDLEENGGFHPDISPDLWRDWPLTHAIATGEETTNQEVLYTLGGGERMLSLSAAPVHDRQGKIIAGVAVIEDITERKENEAELRKARARLEEMVASRTLALAQTNERLQEEIAERARMEQALVAVRRRLAQIREADRLQLARDLHDGPLQDLISLQFQVAAAGQLPLEQAASLPAMLADSLSAVTARLRHLIQELRPPVLAHFGLAAAVRAYAAQLPLPDPPPAIYVESRDEPALDESTALTLFRISQAALRNAVEHSRARKITVRVGREGGREDGREDGPDSGPDGSGGSGRLLLEIEDDGVGFAAPGSRGEMAGQGRLGLAVMAEHAENIGADFSIISRPGAGARVRVLVPLAA